MMEEDYDAERGEIEEHIGPEKVDAKFWWETVSLNVFMLSAVILGARNFLNQELGHQVNVWAVAQKVRRAEEE